MARHVNRTSAAQQAANAVVSQLRKRAAELRDKRKKSAQQLQDFLDAGADKNHSHAVALRNELADFDRELSEDAAEIQEAESVCMTLTAVCSPLNEQLQSWMRALNLGTAEIGLAESGPSLEPTSIIDVSQIAARPARGGAQ
ncbi:MAG: hypothetical protein ABIQ86_12780 [Steroidobacteraceae bacterium]